MDTSRISSLPSVDATTIAVADRLSASHVYRLIGGSIGQPEVVLHKGVRGTMVNTVSSRVELSGSLHDDSVVGWFISGCVAGANHIAVRVHSVSKLFVELKGNNIVLVSDSTKIKVRGHKYFFIHPKSTGGILTEVLGDGARDSPGEDTE